jgi:hypothetical protein
MPTSNQRLTLKRWALPIALHFGLEAYEASLSIDDLKNFALAQKADENRSIPNWVEAWFEGLDWSEQGLKVKHNKEYDKLSKVSPKAFTEWLDKQSKDGKSFIQCDIFKDIKDNALRMTWIEGVDMEERFD